MQKFLLRDLWVVAEQIHLQIDLLHDMHWDTTTEFLVELSIDPPEAGCTLGSGSDIYAVLALESLEK